MNIFQPIFDVRGVSQDMLPPRHADEPIFDVAQLAHVELLTPDLEGTLCFFKDLLGMQETERGTDPPTSAAMRSNTITR